MNYSHFVSESVGCGHPDKVCDQISDAVVDAALKIDPHARVGCETLVKTNKIILAGEVTVDGTIDYEAIARKVVSEIGYTNPLLEFTNNSDVEILVFTQSRDIALGVDTGGAGDQGMMYGYACNETDEFMPLPITLAHELTRGMDELEKDNKFLRPDGKSEVMVKYENGNPTAIDKIILAKPHDNTVTKEEVKELFYKKIILPLSDKYKLNVLPLDEIVLNGTGKWEVGGPTSDSGVTGRKIVVDTYGGMGRIGGGAFSGKDPTKVDRSGAYAARYIAKNVVAAGLADRCEVQLAYVIGYKEPIVKAVETFETEKTNKKAIEDFAFGLMNLSVRGIIEKFDLLRPIYKQTAAYGHFGRPEFPWEKIV
jgi:S-adenosylmethionine synthetase